MRMRIIFEGALNSNKYGRTNKVLWICEMILKVANIVHWTNWVHLISDKRRKGVSCWSSYYWYHCDDTDSYKCKYCLLHNVHSFIAILFIVGDVLVVNLFLKFAFCIYCCLYLYFHRLKLCIYCLWLFIYCC